MTNPRLDRDRPPKAYELFFDFLRERFLSIVGVIAAVVILAMLLGWSIEIPRWLRLAGIVGIAMTPAGLFVGRYVKGLLWEPNYIFLIDLDARVVDGALFKFPFEHFRKLSVVDEDGRENHEYALTELTPNLYVGKQVDLEAMTAQGTWRGTLDDRDLLRALRKIHECRAQLLDDAKRGFAIEVSAFAIVRSAAQDVVRDVVDTFKKGTLPDEGESIDSAIEDALETWNVEDDLGDIEDYDLEELKKQAQESDDPVAESVDEMADQVEQMTDGREVVDAD